MKWHDTPPTKAGKYWVKHRVSGRESIGKPLSFREWFINGSEVYTPERDYQFGPRIPTADELAELPGLVEEYGDAVRSAAICGERSSASQGFYERDGDGIHAKINAILGVADDAGAD